MAMNHALDEVLERYLFKQLPPDEVSALEEHFLLCDSCRQRLQETEDFVAATRIAARRLEDKPGFSFAGLFESIHWTRPAYAALAEGNPNAIVITPVAPLLPGTYRVTARGSGGGALADLNAQALGSDYSFTFNVDASP